ncbi:tetratricopeptide repeat protein [Myroides marinus]|uniref:tetratricopeptide repeat protein n=1 Tax=Myroides marinus TaxID=703342 RepID=UPI000A76B4AE|nr:tetratricopeptide repeat protein [Myroides marinus]
MTLNELDILLRQPQQITEEDATQLKQIIDQYPYFQSVRSLYLKSLYAQNSYNYNQELKTTAAYTLDRDILFDFIVSPDFVAYKPIHIDANIALESTDTLKPADTVTTFTEGVTAPEETEIDVTPTVGQLVNQSITTSEETEIDVTPTVGQLVNEDIATSEETEIDVTPTVGQLVNQDITTSEETEIDITPTVGQLVNEDIATSEETEIDVTPTVGQLVNKDIATSEETEIEESLMRETPEPKLTSTAIKSLLQSITIVENQQSQSKSNSEDSTQEEKAVIEPTVSESLSNEDTITNQKQEEIDKLEEKLDIGSPLNFDEKEKLSFQEWLQLSKIKPIDRENDSILTDIEQKSDVEKQKKIELIDKFIETNPKIVPTKKSTVTPVNIESSVQENSSLMTETLAKIYLEQKKYQKAIQAYEILILKYPEKSSFFANQILDIKALQQHNS